MVWPLRRPPGSPNPVSGDKLVAIKQYADTIGVEKSLLVKWGSKGYESSGVMELAHKDRLLVSGVQGNQNAHMHTTLSPAARENNGLPTQCSLTLAWVACLWHEAHNQVFQMRGCTVACCCEP